MMKTAANMFRGKNKKTKENALKVLTGKSGYGRLDVALSKKQSRVSTLTAAQLSD